MSYYCYVSYCYEYYCYESFFIDPRLVNSIQKQPLLTVQKQPLLTVQKQPVLTVYRSSPNRGRNCDYNCHNYNPNPYLTLLQ